MAGGFSAARLGRMREVLSGHVERGEVIGVVTLVARGDEVHVEAVGVQDRDTRAPMRRDTIFRIASMSKPITAVAAMMLVEECKISLDEPLDRLLPELANRQVLKRIDGPVTETEPARRPLTLRDLLTFRAGYGFVGLDVMGLRGLPLQKAVAESRTFGLIPPTPLEPDDWMRALGALPLAHQPGAQWMYHTGSEILSVLVARAAGQPFGQFLKARIFDPLGMKDTGFTVPDAKLDRLATCYQLNLETRGLEVLDAPATSQWRREPAFPSGGGGLVSTADDYLAFARMMLNKGAYPGGRLLARPTVESMIADQLGDETKAASEFFPDFWETWGWGFGMAMVNRRTGPAMTPGRFGWDGIYGTSWTSDPQEDLIGIMLNQRLDYQTPDTSRLFTDFWTLAYQAIGD